DLQLFLGFANFDRRFIKNYSKKISSLKSFHKKDSHFPLNEKPLRNFQQLKEAFTTAPILSHFNPSLPISVETDASDYALVSVLSQVSDSGKHPIAFDSPNLLPAELNYDIHDKELLGIVWAIKRWRAFLLSLSSSFEVLTNHSSLQYFMTSKILTHCQPTGLKFSLNSIFQSLTTLDALSRQDDVYPERGEDFISKNPMNYLKMIKPQNSFQDPQFYLIRITQDTPAENLSTKVQTVQQDVNRELEAAINRFKRYSDKSIASPPVFNRGNMVWLSSKNIKSNRPTKELSERWLCPFPILEKVSTHSCHLKLPSKWKYIHPVFHISLLKPVKTSTIPNCNQEPPPPFIIEEEEKWEFSQILDSNLKRGKLWYLV
ncbi:hypothetical protein O181_085326, partial [Austropuccinia psidii MF-1]|nr:hypothetical protein [Austropuccinia psidii MF-1]